MNKDSYTIQKFCRICNNTNLVEVLSLGNQYLSGIFPKTKNEPLINAPLALVKCIGKDSCGLVQMKYNFSSDIMYGENYGYRSGLNSSMVKHLENKTEKIKSIINLENDDIILDIGSNDGTTLSFFINSNLNLIGIDPTANNFIDYYHEEVSVLPNFFSSKLFTDKYKSKKAKVIFSLSMFYDLPKPLDFMKEIKSILDVNGIWVVEQSYLPFMLETNSYDTVCHEHYEYYSLKDIKNMTD
ncbi:methyltransferase domain-containing protein, partial [Pelagibacteraceae bacterium]|nr:methyltransferase domain-containing protein [Pelagibacteraceae bacterium]